MGSVVVLIFHSLMSAELHLSFTQSATLKASYVRVDIWHTSNQWRIWNEVKGDWMRMQALWNIRCSTCVLEISSLDVGVCVWGVLGVGGGQVWRDESVQVTKLQWQDTTRYCWSNRTAGGTSNISWALSRDSRSRGAPVCVSPPADGWEVHCWCVLAPMSSTVCEWVAVCGSQRGQLAVADWEGTA